MYNTANHKITSFGGIYEYIYYRNKAQNPVFVTEDASFIK